MAAHVKLQSCLNWFRLSILLRSTNLVMLLDGHEGVFEGFVAQSLQGRGEVAQGAQELIAIMAHRSQRISHGKISLKVQITQSGAVNNQRYLQTVLS